MRDSFPALKRAVTRLVHEERALAALEAIDTTIPPWSEVPGSVMWRAVKDQKRKVKQARETYDRRMRVAEDKTR